jgi:hypothetical protein
VRIPNTDSLLPDIDPQLTIINPQLPDIDPASSEFLHQFSVIRVRRYTQLPLSYGRLDKGLRFYPVYAFFRTATNLTQLNIFQLQIPCYSTSIAVPPSMDKIQTQASLKTKNKYN